MVFVSILPHAEFRPNGHGEDTTHFTGASFIFFLVGRRTGKSLQCTDNNTKENGRFLSRNEFEVEGSSR